MSENSDNTRSVPNQLPSFNLEDYERLLCRLNDVGYRFGLLSELKREGGDAPIAFVRHDIDMHIQGIERMAILEADLQVMATYYVPLTLHFNPLFPKNQATLRQIRKLGHEIGLHYDMETYPLDATDATCHLEWEAGILGHLIGCPIRTICMHQPHKGQPDPFRELEQYVHPHDPRFQDGLLYVSDSCRAWRDENLLQCFGASRPQRLLLTIHPELWLDGDVADRMQYLDRVLMHNGVLQHKQYFDQTVRTVWLTHPAPKLHDERMSHEFGSC